MANLKFREDEIFCLIVNEVIDVEGGFSNDPDDSGGPTKYGIAWNYNHEYLKEHFGIKTWQQMRDTLTKDQARQCYYDKYYVASGAAKLTDEGLAFIHFDCAVNQGVGTAKKLLKKLEPNPFHYDGRGSTNKELFRQLYIDYIVLRLDAYGKLPLAKRKKYMTGWVNRLIETYYDVKRIEGL